MTDFLERWRKRPPDRTEVARAGAMDAAARVQDSLSALHEAERRHGYSEARLLELSPSLARISALEIRERAAKVGLESAKQILDLIRERKSLLAKRPADFRRELETAVQDEATAERTVRECRVAYDPIAAELEELRLTVAKRDGELKQKYGIAA